MKRIFVEKASQMKAGISGYYQECGSIPKFALSATLCLSLLILVIAAVTAILVLLIAVALVTAGPILGFFIIFASMIIYVPIAFISGSQTVSLVISLIIGILVGLGLLFGSILR